MFLSKKAIIKTVRTPIQILSGRLFPRGPKVAWKSPTLKALSYICRKTSFTNAVQRSAGERDQKFPHLSVHTWSEWQENVSLRCVRRCWREATSASHSYVALAFAVRSPRIASALLEKIWFLLLDITSCSYFFLILFLWPEVPLPSLIYFESSVDHVIKANITSMGAPVLNAHSA